MRRYFLSVLLALIVYCGLATTPQAQTLPPKSWTLQSPIISLGDYQCTSISTATTLFACAGLSAIPAGAVFAVVQVEGQSARWRCDGTAPTASVGQPLSALTPLYVTCAASGDVLLSDFKIIPQASSMTIDVSFYGIR